MKIKLPEKWIAHLSHLAESGMGHHRVDVDFEDGSRQRDCIVLNSETIELADSNRGKRITDIRLHEEEHPTTSNPPR